MLIRRLGGLCIAVIGALAFSQSCLATPISIMLDTSQFVGQTFLLDFQLAGSASDSIAITGFSTDGTTDPTTIVTSNGVTGSLDTNDLVLTGGGAFIPADYEEPITLGNALAFAFEATTQGGDDLPALFAFQLLDPQTSAPPLGDNGPLFGSPDSGVLLTFEFGTTDAAGFTLFSTAALPVGQVPEPASLALVGIALFLSLAARARDRIRSRR